MIGLPRTVIQWAQKFFKWEEKVVVGGLKFLAYNNSSPMYFLDVDILIDFHRFIEIVVE